MAEKMTEKELETLRMLQAKHKRAQRAEAEFLKDADARKEELMERWGKSDRLSKAARTVGTDEDTLYDWITSDPQVEFFRRKHQHDVTTDSRTVDDIDIPIV